MEHAVEVGRSSAFRGDEVRRSPRRPIGQILSDGGFISPEQLERALEEQKRSNELVGQVLVRMGIVDERELNVALAVQKHLGDLGQAVAIAAGVREMFGSLLLKAGRITAAQLDLAIAEQKKSGKMLGELCVEMGFITQAELDGLLSFQSNQSHGVQSGNPLRLGELLVCAGYITRGQLDEALQKQTLTQKKLGEVLVEEGYAEPSQIRHGMRLQNLLMTSVLAAILSLATLTMSGCGGGGEDTATPAPASTTGVVTAPPAVEHSVNYFTVTEDQLGLVAPTFYYSTDNYAFWSIQANLAKSATDIDSVSVYRIDIPKNGNPIPELNKSFSIEEGGTYDKFPGSFFVFNGEKSVKKRVERGTITFSPDSVAAKRVKGTFEVVVTDYDSGVTPAPERKLKGSFHFVMGTCGPATI
jgi:hypothetical protein